MKEGPCRLEDLSSHDILLGWPGSDPEVLAQALTRPSLVILADHPSLGGAEHEISVSYPISTLAVPRRMEIRSKRGKNRAIARSILGNAPYAKVRIRAKRAPGTVRNRAGQSPIRGPIRFAAPRRETSRACPGYQ